jgi:phosphoglycerol transferase MdoB-like AlkP superfamily enzyme
LYMMHSNEESVQLITPDYTIAQDTFPGILKNPVPNIVYIFLEGWSADNVGILGGIKDCTPQFDALCNEGILFAKAYSNGYVSDQGIVVGLSAFPAAHRLAIANQPTKIHNLPCITDHLIPLGYSTSFLFGGELVYGNLRGYLLEKQFSELKEVYHLGHYPSGRLGVHDEYTFKELLLMLNQKKQPFLQCYFTTSTHMPYDHPKTDNWQSTKDDPEKSYSESVHYSDIHLGKFFVEAKKQSWYPNTLFIIVSDHSHNSIRQNDPVSSMQQHIPMLFVGGALKEEWRGKKWEKIVSQLDIVSTLLHQMNIDSRRFPWSRNMLNPHTPSSAFYVFYGGAGYINDSGFAASYYNSKDYICTNISDSTIAKFYQTKAFSFQQLVFENVRLRK